MGEIHIDPGETAELVPNGTGGEWEVHMLEGEGRFHKLYQRARTHGRVRKQGDRGVVELGDSEGLYAYAPDGARVHVEENNFSFTLFSQREIVRPQDSAAAANNYDFVGSRDTVLAGTELATIINWTNDTGEDVVVTFAGGNVEGAYASDLRAQIEISDADGTSNFIGEMNWPHLPFDFPEPVPVPAGGDVLVAVSNDTSADQTVQMFVNYRSA